MVIPKMKIGKKKSWAIHIGQLNIPFIKKQYKNIVQKYTFFTI